MYAMHARMDDLDLPGARRQRVHMDDRMTPGSIRALWIKGLNNKQIADHYGITPQAVSDMARRYDLYGADPRKQVKDAFPWKVLEKHRLASPNKRLRDHGEYFYSGGDGMSPNKLYRLAGFYRRLRQLRQVITYEPDYEPDS